MIPPNPARAVCPASAALPHLSSAQANALRLADRDGLRWTGVCWVWGDAGVGVRVILAATVDALERRGCLYQTRSNTMYPSDVGCAWLAANPDPAA